MERLIIYLHRNVNNSKFIEKKIPLKFDLSTCRHLLPFQLYASAEVKMERWKEKLSRMRKKIIEDGMMIS